MSIPSSSWSITMRVHLGADPLGIGRITTAVGEAAGTVVWDDPLAEDEWGLGRQVA
jgi:hypothetical protein